MKRTAKRVGKRVHRQKCKIPIFQHRVPKVNGRNITVDKKYYMAIEKGTRKKGKTVTQRLIEPWLHPPDYGPDHSSPP
jgi:hypothetical protein